MSSAILYLAIVAIWALVLVPHWLRKGHPGSPDVEEAEADLADPGLGEAATGDARSGADQDADHAQTERAQGPCQTDWGARAPRTAASRDRVLRTRRRMLTTLVLLAAGAVAMAVAGIAAWWVVVPPAALLGGFILVLRAAVRIDTERAAAARSRATQREGPAARTAGTPRAPASEAPFAAALAPSPAAAASAGPPRPDAEIIDISGRVEEQPYDQYLDAEARAVGD